jgi:molybdopterin-guanine dinucleotide biosynthesis protein A
MRDDRRPIVGVILAGGRSRRMLGRDKSLLLLDGKSLLARSIARLAPQVDAVVVSANGQSSQYAPFGAPVVADSVEGFVGPLAGMLAGMAWARNHVPAASSIATVAVDTPFFPRDLVARLAAGAGTRRVAIAASGGRMHPVFALAPVDLAEDLASFLAATESLRVADWLARHNPIDVAFEAGDGVDPFFNINTPEDLAEAEAVAASCAGR